MDLTHLDFPLEVPCEVSDHERYGIPVQTAEFMVVCTCQCNVVVAFCSGCLSRKLALSTSHCGHCGDRFEPASTAYSRIEPIR